MFNLTRNGIFHKQDRDPRILRHLPYMVHPVKGRTLMGNTPSDIGRAATRPYVRQQTARLLKKKLQKKQDKYTKSLFCPNKNSKQKLNIQILGD